MFADALTWNVFQETAWIFHLNGEPDCQLFISFTWQRGWREGMLIWSEGSGSFSTMSKLKCHSIPVQNLFPFLGSCFRFWRAKLPVCSNSKQCRKKRPWDLFSGVHVHAVWCICKPYWIMWSESVKKQRQPAVSKRDPMQNPSASKAIKKMDLGQRWWSFLHDTQWAIISSDNTHALQHLVKAMWWSLCRLLYFQ